MSLPRHDETPLDGGRKRARLGYRLRDAEVELEAAIIRALDDPPASLAELRGVLLTEHEWRAREGFV